MTDIKQILVVDCDEKIRLDNFLVNQLDGWTRSQIKKQIDDNRVVINGKPISKAGFIVKKGDIIEIDLIAIPDFTNVEPEEIPLEIVYEDDNLAVINKQQGLVVHPANSCPNHTLVNALLYHFKQLSDNGEKFRPGIVHRLDKLTSGLMVVAKNNESHVFLAKQLADHTLGRTYVALCDGEFKEISGDIIKPIAHNPKDYKKMAIVSTGKYAETHYEVLAIFKGYSLVEFNLKTGRTHQIRVHAKSINHPIVGDSVYGLENSNFKLNGQLLHAREIKFIHPTTNQEMRFKVKIPDYFKNVIKKLTLKWQKSVDILDDFV